MRDGVLAALLTLAAAAPLLAAVVTVAAGKLIPRARIHWPAACGSAVTLAAGIVLWVLLPESGTIPRAPLVLYRWISIPADAVSVTVGLQLDAISALILLASAMATLVVVLHAGRTTFGDSSPRFFATLSLLQSASVMLLLATDFLQLVFFWQLTAAIAFLLEMVSKPIPGGRGWTAGKPRSCNLRGFVKTPTPATHPKPVLKLPLRGSDTQARVPSILADGRFLWNRAADVALLTAAFLFENRFGTFDLRAGVDAASIVSPAGDAGLVSFWSFGLCLLFAAAARCGQFPLRVGQGRGRDEFDQSSAASGALIEAALFMPVGVYLIARFLPLLAASSSVSTGMICIGGLSALAGSISAAAQTDPKRMLSASTTSLYGLMFLGLGTGTPSGIRAALLLLVVYMLAKTSLLLTAGDAPATKTNADSKTVSNIRTGMFLTAAMVLCSGIWGQNALLAAVWRTVRQPLLSDSFNVLSIAYWSAMISLLFLAIAMTRGVFSVFHTGARIGQRDEKRIAVTWVLPWFLPIAAAVAGPILVGSIAWSDGGNTTIVVSDWNPAELTSLLKIDFGLLLVLLGVIAAWLGSTQTVTLPSQAAGIFRPFVTWARSGYGLDGLWTTVLSLPIRGLSWFCRLADRFLIDAATTELPARLLSLPARAAAPLRNGLVQFYALSVLLAMALLLVVLTWLRG